VFRAGVAHAGAADFQFLYYPFAPPPLLIVRIFQEWKEERRKKLEQDRLSRQKLEQHSSLSDDPTTKSGSRPQSRVTDPKSVKRTGPPAQKGPPSRRRSSSSSRDVDASGKHSSDSDMNKTPSEMNLIDLENDFELFFTDPQQLLAIFTELEEQNLSLIQNSQDHEEQLEEISRELQITMEKKNSETESLQRQVNYLEQSITLEQQKEKELMAKVG
jgi:hypothetical protein